MSAAETSLDRNCLMIFRVHGHAQKRTNTSRHVAQTKRIAFPLEADSIGTPLKGAGGKRLVSPATTHLGDLKPWLTNRFLSILPLESYL